MNSQRETIERRMGRSALTWLATLPLVFYTGVLILSDSFGPETPLKERPIILVLALFLAAFAVYLIAIPVAIRCTQDRRLVWTILVTSLVFRLLLLPSTPIQEVDIYRYLWDGVTTCAGISPFHYTPLEIRNTDPQDEVDEDLARLADLSQSKPELGRVLQHVHHPRLPTVYPPVSQAVFAAAAWTTPAGATVEQRMLVMKFWLLLFDMTTLGLILWLLKLTGRPLGLGIIYGWCPLVMKEFANSGHLDAVAVCLTTLAVCLAVRLMLVRSNSATWMAAAASIILALAVGAKLYPVVLFPLVMLAIGRQVRWHAVIPAIVFCAATALVLAPMLVSRQTRHPIHSSDLPQTIGQPAAGLKAFLTRWEMNDFLFLIVIENVKTADVRGDQTAWFSIVPESFRERAIAQIPKRYVADRWGAAFLVSRCPTLIAFAAITVWLFGRSVRRPAVTVWLEAAFLTLAWFWLLSPTLNPWYWTWALPLLPFARNRAWLAVSGLVLIYYMRFWYIYHFPDTHVPGTQYIGAAFFDLVVTWVEFGPWFVFLFGTWLYRKRVHTRTCSAGELNV